MFDHRIPNSSTPPYAHIAAVLVIALACLFVFGRIRGEKVVEKLAIQNAQVSTRPAIPATAQAKPVRRDEPILQLAILVFKSEKRMEVWAQRSQTWKQLRDYPVLAASGTAGPKLIEGDRQVPEGIYRITEMNPASRLHRSIKIDYPNAFDRKMASSDGRIKLGGDICIHGKSSSIGCVAIGDPAIEDLYALVESIGAKKTTVIIAPNDLRSQIAVKNPKLKLTWLPELNTTLTRELKPFEKAVR